MTDNSVDRSAQRGLDAADSLTVRSPSDPGRPSFWLERCI
jgi:hypothetical protein